MKKFQRHLNLDELRKKCDKHHFNLDTKQYEQGSDYVTIYAIFDGMRVALVYSVFNGRFIASNDKRELLGSSDDNLDGAPWFDAAMRFVYTDKKAAAAA